MNYSTLKDTWICKRPRNLVMESYEPRVTMPLPEWRNYIADGKNVLYGSAIIPNGSINTGIENGAVYKGQVGQPMIGGCGCRNNLF